jgi:hypothetical protein
MVRKGFYVLGLEPGNSLPLGRGVLREKGTLPHLEGQAECSITIDFEVIDDKAGFDAIEKESRSLVG